MLNTGAPTRIVREFIAAIERKDVDAAVALAAPAISYENMPINPIVGREGLTATLQAFLAPALEVSWPVAREVEQGSTVINERVDRFRLAGGWVELPVVGIFEVGDDGLITLWRDYFDMGAYQRQVAAVSAPAS